MRIPDGSRLGVKEDKTNLEERMKTRQDIRRSTPVSGQERSNGTGRRLTRHYRITWSRGQNGKSRVPVLTHYPCLVELSSHGGGVFICQQARGGCGTVFQHRQIYPLPEKWTLGWMNVGLKAIGHRVLSFLGVRAVV